MLILLAYIELHNHQVKILISQSIIDFPLSSHYYLLTCRARSVLDPVSFKILDAIVFLI
jgi:hypothetical protein